MTFALAKIGGLLSLLKFVSVILKEYHRRLFESQIRRFSSEHDLVSKDEESFKDLFTFERFRQVMKEKDIDTHQDAYAMNKTFNSEPIELERQDHKKL